MVNLDFEIFEGKTFRDLCKDVVKRSESKKDQLDTLYSDTRNLIKNADQARLLLPELKAFLDVGVKNDEQLIKLAGVLQRLQSSQIETGNDGTGLTDAEKTQLLQNTLQEVGEIKKEVDSDIPVKDTTPLFAKK